MWKNRKGFTLIEIIIVIAIIGVLAGSSVAMIGHIRYANTKKVVEEVEDALSRLRLETMSQEAKEEQCLYIYKMDDGYYMKQDKRTTGGGYSVVLSRTGTRLCGNNVTITKDSDGLLSDSDGETATSSFIRIAYTKGGLFRRDDSDHDVQESITISGSGTYKIMLDSEVGRPYIVE